MHREAETQAEGEVGSPQEPDAGLDPRTPGSRPERKGDAQPLRPPRRPYWVSSNMSTERSSHL